VGRALDAEAAKPYAPRAAIHHDPAESWEAGAEHQQPGIPTTARSTNPQLKTDRLLPGTFQASSRFASYGLFMKIWLKERRYAATALLGAGLFGAGLALSPMSQAEPLEPRERDRVERELREEAEEQAILRELRERLIDREGRGAPRDRDELVRMLVWELMAAHREYGPVPPGDVVVARLTEMLAETSNDELSEFVARVRFQREARDRFEREEREAVERKEREAAERKEREAAEREKREAAGREKREAAEREKREAAEREEREAIERMERDRVEREKREAAEREEREAAEAAERAEREELEGLGAMPAEAEREEGEAAEREAEAEAEREAEAAAEREAEDPAEREAEAAAEREAIERIERDRVERALESLEREYASADH